VAPLRARLPSERPGWDRWSRFRGPSVSGMGRTFKVGGPKRRPS